MNRDLAGKNELLRQHNLGPLTEFGAAVVRCSECILSRQPIYGEEGDPPSFTIPDIQRCLGAPAFHAVKLLKKAGLVTEHAFPPQRFYGGSRPPLVYRPQESADSRFFTIAPRPGCERTAQSALIEALKPGSQRPAL